MEKRIRKDILRKYVVQDLLLFYLNYFYYPALYLNIQFGVGTNSILYAIVYSIIIFRNIP